MLEFEFFSTVYIISPQNDFKFLKLKIFNIGFI